LGLIPTAPILAAFVSPALFYAGAAAVSLPILIHLLARRRFKRIRWAAIEFLLQAEKRNRRRVRLEELILLLLRCLAVVLVALLVARPFFRPEGLAGLLGGAQQTERIFLLDDSFSMGLESGDGTVFDRAKRAVVQLVKLLSEQSPQDVVTVVRTSAMESPVAAGVFLDPRQTEDLFARLEGLKVSERAMSVTDVFQSVRRALDDQPDTINVTLYVVSDFQRKDWLAAGGWLNEAAARKDLSLTVAARMVGDSNSGAGAPSPAPQEAGATAGASPIATLADWAGANRGLSLVLVDVGAADAQNVAVTGIEAARSRIVAGVSSNVRASLSNFTPLPRSADLDISIGSIAQATVTVPEVQPADTTEVAVPISVVRPGSNWVRVAAPQDALPVDDARTLVFEAVESIRVLLVDGEPSADTYRDEVSLLRTAIRPPGEVFSGNDVTVIDEAELEDTRFDEFDVVVLANVYRVPGATADALGRFVRDGGGLALFLGDQVDADAYNATLYADGGGVLPAQLNERRTAPAGGVRLEAGDVSHPIVQIYGGAENPFVQNIYFEQYFACTAAGGEEGTEGRRDEGTKEEGTEARRHEGTKEEGTDSSSLAPRRAQVIARFADGDGTPAVIERVLGRGRVVLFTSSCDLEWNDWAKDPSFVVTALELVQYLSRGGGVEADLRVGSPIELPIDPGRFEPLVRVRTPAYPAEAEVDVAAAPDAEGQGFRLRWEQTETSGVYQFVLTTRSGEEAIRAVAVNLDPVESDPSRASEAELRRALPEMPFTFVAGLDSLQEAGEEARRELWRTVLLAAVLVLMGEQFLAWYFGRRNA